MTEDNYSNSLI